VLGEDLAYRFLDRADDDIRIAIDDVALRAIDDRSGLVDRRRENVGAAEVDTDRM
jgi:hypothetical protein